MWKKGELEEGPGAVSPAAQPSSRQTAPTGGRREPATIGPSITIKGEVSGDEDLMIQGKVDGTVTLHQHNVTIGQEGRVKADVAGKIVVVEGEVEGDLRGAEQVVLRRSARVKGNISAPRVSLEDGAGFRGGIDMNEAGAKASAPAVFPADHSSRGREAKASGGTVDAPKGEASKA